MYFIWNDQNKRSRFMFGYNCLIFRLLKGVVVGFMSGAALYDPKTLVCSSFEANRLKEIGVNSFIANELSKEELKMIEQLQSNINN